MPEELLEEELLEEELVDDDETPDVEPVEDPLCWVDVLAAEASPPPPPHPDSCENDTSNPAESSVSPT